MPNKQPHIDTAIVSLASANVSHVVLRRYERVGHTPVAEVRVTYPVLAVCEDDQAFAPAVVRFNEAYRAMAEAFLHTGVEHLLQAARDAFASAGTGAVYTFDRHLIACCMEASVSPGNSAENDRGGGIDGRLVVRRTVRMSSRRGTVPTVLRESSEVWRLSDLSLMHVR